MAEPPEEKIIAFCREHNTTPAAMFDCLPSLIEAAETLANNLEAYEKKGIRGLTMPGEPIEEWHTMPIGADKLFALRAALQKIHGDR